MALGFWTDVLRSLHLRGLTETVDAVRQRWGGSRLLLGLDIVWCALRYGAGFQDYRLFAFESLTGRQRRTYLTRGSNRRLVDRQNPKSLRFLLEDKGTFDRLFLSQLGRPFLDLRVAGPEEFRSFWRAHPELVAKRPRGKCGQDVFFLPRQEPDDLYRELLERGAVLVEPRIHQHPALDGLYPGSVNTARIVTLQTGDGPRILYACLRMGNGTPVDNLDAGGLCAPLDLTTGCVTQPAGDKRGGCFPRHPVTGTQIPGFCLPDWQAAKPWSWRRRSRCRVWDTAAGMCASCRTVPLSWRATPTPAMRWSKCRFTGAQTAWAFCRRFGGCCGRAPRRDRPSRRRGRPRPFPDSPRLAVRDFGPGFITKTAPARWEPGRFIPDVTC